MVAAAALADTLAAVAACGAARKVLALDGEPGPWLPPGFEVLPQRGVSFNERLANAWGDVGGPGLQIGMDTPQVRASELDGLLARLDAPLAGPARRAGPPGPAALRPPPARGRGGIGWGGAGPPARFPGGPRGAPPPRPAPGTPLLAPRFSPFPAPP